jgi:hypothetical protein
VRLTLGSEFMPLPSAARPYSASQNPPEAIKAGITRSRESGGFLNVGIPSTQYARVPRLCEVPLGGTLDAFGQVSSSQPVSRI